MIIIYTPKVLPIRCNFCKTVFIPEIGDIHFSESGFASDCPCCGMPNYADFASDRIADVPGNTCKIDARTNPPCEGQIIFFWEEDHLVVARADGVVKFDEEANAIEHAFATIIATYPETKRRGRETSFIYYGEL